MKTFDNLNYEERKEIIYLIANWLRKYTHEVIVKVLAKRDEILNNEFTMNLLKELKKREEEEAKTFEIHMGFLLDDYEGFKEHDSHNHALTHADSYRNVLYDMYIKD